VARILLTSVVDRILPPDHEDLRPLRVMRRCAERDRFGAHRVAESLADADLVLFVEQRGPGLYQRPLWDHPFVRLAPDRCFAFCAIDHVVPFLPGIYPSQPAHGYRPDRHRGGHYLQGLLRPNPGPLPLADPPRLLASFRGRFATHRIRRRLAQVAAGPRIVIENTDGAMAQERHGREFMGYGGEDVAAFYALTRDSAFVLAPRGYGASSMRLFEAMQVARAPVIIGDAWVPPVGPDWPSFSVRVREADVVGLPSLLADLEPRAAALGRAARQAWDDWFSEEVTFHRAVEWCLAIQRERPCHEPIARWTAYARLFDRDVLAARARNVRARLSGRWPR